MKMKNDIEQLRELADLMNDQSQTPTIVTDDLLYVFDAALEREEVDFLLKMGGGNKTRADIEKSVGSSGEEFDRIFNLVRGRGDDEELRNEDRVDVEDEVETKTTTTSSKDDRQD